VIIDQLEVDYNSSDFHCQHLCISSFAPNLVYGSHPSRRLDMKDIVSVSTTTS